MFKNVPMDLYNKAIQEFNEFEERYHLVRILFFYKNKTSKTHPFGYYICGGGCHSAIGSFGIGHSKHTPLFIVTAGLGRKWKNTETIGAKGYVPWLVNQSPWADLHMVKDVDYILKTGYHLDCDFPHNYFQSGCITSRHSWEVIHDRLKDWDTYVNSFGFDPTLALLFRYNSFLDIDGNVIPNNWGGHTAFSPTEKLSYYKNIFNKRMIHPKELYSVTKTYDDVDRLWLDKNETLYSKKPGGLFQKAYEIFLELSKEKVTVDKTQLKVVNPFLEAIGKMNVGREQQIIPAKFMPEIGKRLLTEMRN